MRRRVIVRRRPIRAAGDAKRKAASLAVKSDRLIRQALKLAQQASKEYKRAEDVDPYVATLLKQAAEDIDGAVDRIHAAALELK